MFFVARCTIDPGIPWHPLEIQEEQAEGRRQKKKRRQKKQEAAGHRGSHRSAERLVVSNTRKGNQTMAMEKPQLISADY